MSENLESVELLHGEPTSTEVTSHESPTSSEGVSVKPQKRWRRPMMRSRNIVTDC